jgi:hypothetical protein
VELTRYTITDQHYDPMHARNAFDVYLAVEADRLLSTLKEQLANAQSEAKFAREHLERERALRTPAQEAGDVRCKTCDGSGQLPDGFTSWENAANFYARQCAIAVEEVARLQQPAEPVFTTDFQDTGAPLSDLVHRKPAPATGLTREEVDEKRRMYSETELAALYEMSDSVAVKGAALRNLIDDLRNLAARK